MEREAERNRAKERESEENIILSIESSYFECVIARISKIEIVLTSQVQY